MLEKTRCPIAAHAKVSGNEPDAHSTLELTRLLDASTDSSRKTAKKTLRNLAPLCMADTMLSAV